MLSDQRLCFLPFEVQYEDPVIKPYSELTENEVFACLSELVFKSGRRTNWTVCLLVYGMILVYIYQFTFTKSFIYGSKKDSIQ